MVCLLPCLRPLVTIFLLAVDTPRYFLYNAAERSDGLGQDLHAFGESFAYSYFNSSSIVPTGINNPVEALELAYEVSGETAFGTTYLRNTISRNLAAVYSDSAIFVAARETESSSVGVTWSPRFFMTASDLLDISGKQRFGHATIEVVDIGPASTVAVLVTFLEAQNQEARYLMLLDACTIDRAVDTGPWDTSGREISPPCSNASVSRGMLVLNEEEAVSKGLILSPRAFLESAGSNSTRVDRLELAGVLPLHSSSSSVSVRDGVAVAGRPADAEIDVWIRRGVRNWSKEKAVDLISMNATGLLGGISKAEFRASLFGSKVYLTDSLLIVHAPGLTGSLIRGGEDAHAANRLPGGGPGDTMAGAVFIASKPQSVPTAWWSVAPDRDSDIAAAASQYILGHDGFVGYDPSYSSTYSRRISLSNSINFANTSAYQAPTALCRWAGDAASIPFDTTGSVALSMGAEDSGNGVVTVVVGNPSVRKVGVLEVRFSFEAAEAPGTGLSATEELAAFYLGTTCSHTHTLLTFSSNEGDSFGHDVAVQAEHILISSPTSKNDYIATVHSDGRIYYRDYCYRGRYAFQIEGPQYYLVECRDCDGGMTSSPGRLRSSSCVPCTNNKPVHARWLPGSCWWKCKDGYYGSQCQSCSDVAASAGVSPPKNATWVNGGSSCGAQCIEDYSVRTDGRSCYPPLPPGAPAKPYLRMPSQNMTHQWYQEAGVLSFLVPDSPTKLLEMVVDILECPTAASNEVGCVHHTRWKIRNLYSSVVGFLRENNTVLSYPQREAGSDGPLQLRSASAATGAALLSLSERADNSTVGKHGEGGAISVLVHGMPGASKVRCRLKFSNAGGSGPWSVLSNALETTPFIAPPEAPLLQILKVAGSNMEVLASVNRTGGLAFDKGEACIKDGGALEPACTRTASIQSVRSLMPSAAQADREALAIFTDQTASKTGGTTLDSRILFRGLKSGSAILLRVGSHAGWSPWSAAIVMPDVADTYPSLPLGISWYNYTCDSLTLLALPSWNSGGSNSSLKVAAIPVDAAGANNSSQTSPRPLVVSSNLYEILRAEWTYPSAELNFEGDVDSDYVLNAVNSRFGATVDSGAVQLSGLRAGISYQVLAVSANSFGSSAVLANSTTVSLPATCGSSIALSHPRLSSLSCDAICSVSLEWRGSSGGVPLVEIELRVSYTLGPATGTTFYTNLTRTGSHLEFFRVSPGLLELHQGMLGHAHADSEICVAATAISSSGFRSLESPEICAATGPPTVPAPPSAVLPVDPGKYPDSVCAQIVAPYTLGGVPLLNYSVILQDDTSRVNYQVLVPSPSSACAQISCNGPQGEGAGVPVVCLEGLDTGRSYTMEISSHNAVGSSARVGFDTLFRTNPVAGPPDPPTIKNATSTRPTELSIVVEYPKRDGGARITGYSMSVYIEENDQELVFYQDFLFGRAELGRYQPVELLATGLQGLTTYQVSIIAFRGTDCDQPGSILQESDCLKSTPVSTPVRTAVPLPPGEPCSLSAAISGPGMARIIWKSPSFRGGGPIRYFEVNIRQEGNNSEFYSWRTDPRSCNSLSRQDAYCAFEYHVLQEIHRVEVCIIAANDGSRSDPACTTVTFEDSLPWSSSAPILLGVAKASDRGSDALYAYFRADGPLHQSPIVSVLLSHFHIPKKLSSSATLVESWNRTSVELVGQEDSNTAFREFALSSATNFVDAYRPMNFSTSEFFSRYIEMQIDDGVASIFPNDAVDGWRLGAPRGGASSPTFVARHDIIAVKLPSSSNEVASSIALEHVDGHISAWSSTAVGTRVSDILWLNAAGCTNTLERASAIDRNLALIPEKWEAWILHPSCNMSVFGPLDGQPPGVSLHSSAHVGVRQVFLPNQIWPDTHLEDHCYSYNSALYAVEDLNLQRAKMQGIQRGWCILRAPRPRFPDTLLLAGPGSLYSICSINSSGFSRACIYIASATDRSTVNQISSNRLVGDVFGTVISNGSISMQLPAVTVGPTDVVEFQILTFNPRSCIHLTKIGANEAILPIVEMPQNCSTELEGDLEAAQSDGAMGSVAARVNGSNWLHSYLRDFRGVYLECNISARLLLSTCISVTVECLGSDKPVSQEMHMTYSDGSAAVVLPINHTSLLKDDGYYHSIARYCVGLVILPDEWWVRVTTSRGPVFTRGALDYISLINVATFSSRPSISLSGVQELPAHQSGVLVSVSALSIECYPRLADLYIGHQAAASLVFNPCMGSSRILLTGDNMYELVGYNISLSTESGRIMSAMIPDVIHSAATRGSNQSHGTSGVLRFSPPADSYYCRSSNAAVFCADDVTASPSWDFIRHVDLTQGVLGVYFSGCRVVLEGMSSVCFSTHIVYEISGTTYLSPTITYTPYRSPLPSVYWHGSSIATLTVTELDQQQAITAVLEREYSSSVDVYLEASFEIDKFYVVVAGLFIPTMCDDQAGVTQKRILLNSMSQSQSLGFVLSGIGPYSNVRASLKYNAAAAGLSRETAVLLGKVSGQRQLYYSREPPTAVSLTSIGGVPSPTRISAYIQVPLQSTALSISVVAIELLQVSTGVAIYATQEALTMNASPGFVSVVEPSVTDCGRTSGSSCSSVLYDWHLGTAGTLEMTFSDLRASTAYKGRARFVFEDGSISQWSEYSFSYETSEPRIPGRMPAVVIIASSVSSEKAAFKWTADAVDLGGAAVVGVHFKVVHHIYKFQGGNSTSTVHRATVLMTSKCLNGTEHIDGLLGSNMYSVSVAVENELGIGPWSEASEQFLTQAPIAPGLSSINAKYIYTLGTIQQQEIPISNQSYSPLKVELQALGGTGGSAYICTEVLYFYYGKYSDRCSHSHQSVASFGAVHHNFTSAPWKETGGILPWPTESTLDIQLALRTKRPRLAEDILASFLDHPLVLSYGCIWSNVTTIGVPRYTFGVVVSRRVGYSLAQAPSLQFGHQELIEPIVPDMALLSGKLELRGAFSHGVAVLSPPYPPQQLPAPQLLATTSSSAVLNLRGYNSYSSQFNMTCHVSRIFVADIVSGTTLWSDVRNASAHVEPDWIGILLGGTFRLTVYNLNHTTAYQLAVGLQHPTATSSLSEAVPVRTANREPTEPVSVGVLPSWINPVQIGLKWTKPQSNGGRSISNYRIERAFLGRVPPGTNPAEIPSGIDDSSLKWSLTEVVSAEVNAMNVSGLSPDSMYAVRVLAENSVGIGPPSDTVIGFTFPARDCPAACSGNGYCHAWKGICSCDFGFTHPDCSRIAGAVVELVVDVNIEDFRASDFQSQVSMGLGLQGYSSLRVHVVQARAGSTKAATAFLTKAYVEQHFSLTSPIGGPSSAELVLDLADSARSRQGWLLGLGISAVRPPDTSIIQAAMLPLEPSTVPPDGITINLPECSTASTCEECTRVPGCGFCGTLYRCMSGGRVGPSSNAEECPLEYAFYYHPSGLNPSCPMDCNTLTSCTACANRQDCAWCDASSTCTTRATAIQDIVAAESLGWSSYALQSTLNGKVGPLRCGYPIVSPASCPAQTCSGLLSTDLCLEASRCGWCDGHIGSPSGCSSGDAFGWTDTPTSCFDRYMFSRNGSERACNSLSCEECRQSSGCGWCASSNLCGEMDAKTLAPVYGTCSHWVPAVPAAAIADINTERIKENTFAAGRDLPDGTAAPDNIDVSMQCPTPLEQDLEATCRAASQSCAACTAEPGCGWCLASSGAAACIPEATAVESGLCPRLDQDDIGFGGLADPPLFVNACPLSCSTSAVSMYRCGTFSLEPAQAQLASEPLAVQSLAYSPATRYRYYPSYISGCTFSFQPVADYLVGYQFVPYSQIDLDFSEASHIGENDAFLVYKGTPENGLLIATVTGVELSNNGNSSGTGRESSRLSSHRATNGTALDLSGAVSRFNELVVAARQAAPVYSIRSLGRLNVGGGQVSVVFVTAIGGHGNFNVSYCGVGSTSSGIPAAVVIIAVIAVVVAGACVGSVAYGLGRGPEDGLPQTDEGGEVGLAEQGQMPGFLIKTFPAFKFSLGAKSDIPMMGRVTSVPAQEPSHVDSDSATAADAYTDAAKKEKTSEEPTAAQPISNEDSYNDDPSDVAARSSSCEPEESPSCSICMCEFEEGDVARMLSCRHLFHAECVDRWLHAKGYCPMCRADAVHMAVMLQSRLEAGEVNPLGFGSTITLLSHEEQNIGPSSNEQDSRRNLAISPTQLSEEVSEDSLPSDEDSDHLAGTGTQQSRSLDAEQGQSNNRSRWTRGEDQPRGSDRSILQRLGEEGEVYHNPIGRQVGIQRQRYTQRNILPQVHQQQLPGEDRSSGQVSQTSRRNESLGVFSAVNPLHVQSMRT